jgi:hypothetical protein
VICPGERVCHAAGWLPLPVPSNLGQPHDGGSEDPCSGISSGGNRRGCNTDGLAGHRMMTTAGVSLASISSITSVSTALIWPDASSVETWDFSS